MSRPANRVMSMSTAFMPKPFGRANNDMCVIIFVQCRSSGIKI